MRNKILLFLLFVLVISFTGRAQNMVPNGTFDANIDGWTYTSGSNANSWDAATQQLKAHIVTPGTSYTSYQFYYYPAATPSFFEVGESYILKFDAYAATQNHSVDVACGFNGGAYTNFVSNADRYVAITTTKTTYTINFTVSSSYTSYRVGFRIGGSAGNIAQDLYFDNIILTKVIPPPPPETYAIYTEDPTIIAGTGVTFQNVKAFTIASTGIAPYEGAESKLFSYDKTDTWAMAQVMPVGGTVNINGYKDGFYNFAMKSTSPKPFRIRMKGGGQTGYIEFSQGADPYGFVRDGNWHFLSIPLSAFKANNPAINFSTVTELMVIRSLDGQLAITDNLNLEIDNFYLSLNYPAVPEVILPNAWINEFHYDNVGTDVNEFVEVIIENASLYTLSNFRVDLYNSQDGTSYDHLTLDQFVQGNTVGTFTFFTWHPAGGIQNDNADGIALSYIDGLIQFISYEGSHTATDGPALGVTSVNTLVAEPCANAQSGVNYSIQLVGQGVKYSHFNWIDPPATPGALNVDNQGNLQVLDFPIAVPVNWRYIALVFLVISIFTLFNSFRMLKRRREMNFVR